MDITVVDDKKRFVFLPLLYELAVGKAGVDEVAPTFESVFAGSGVVSSASSILAITSGVSFGSTAAAAAATRLSPCRLQRCRGAAKPAGAAAVGVAGGGWGGRGHLGGT